MASTGRVRVTMGKLVLVGVERLPDEQHHQVLRRVPTSVIESIQDGLMLGWLDADDYHQLVGPVFETLGVDAFRSFFTTRYLQFAEQATLGAITQTALRLGSATPVGLARYAPAAWRHLSSGLGELSFVAGATPPRLQYVGYPTSSAPPGMFAHAFAGSFDGFYPLCKRSGRVEIVDLDLSQGNASFVLQG